MSWKSVAEARYVDPTAGLSAAIIDAAEVPHTRELIDVLAELETADFVFVRDEANKIAGMVDHCPRRTVRLSRRYGPVRA